jgi:hypothetical protein
MFQHLPYQFQGLSIYFNYWLSYHANLKIKEIGLKEDNKYSCPATRHDGDWEERRYNFY